MITHEEIIITKYETEFVAKHKDYDVIGVGSNEFEAVLELSKALGALNKTTQLEHEALKRDVYRYVELDFFHIAPYKFKKKYANENKLIGETVKESISRLDNEWLSFIQKLKKVGKEE